MTDLSSKPITPPPTEKIKNYLILSLLCTIFCFPTAVISIRESLRCEEFKKANNWDAAQNASLKAKRWLIYSLLLGIISILGFALMIYLLYPLLIEGFDIIRDFYKFGTLPL
ncbi:MAG: CD225/dispanin family protein [Akkermansia sp.]